MISNLPQSILHLKYPKFFFVIILFGFLALLPLLIRGPFYSHILIMIFLHAAGAASWNLIGGYAGQLSLGHAAFYGIGAYTSTLLFIQQDISPWIGMLAGGVVAAIVAGLISFPCFKLRGPFFALATIAFAEVVRILAIYSRGLTRGAIGITIPFRPGLGNLMFHGKTAYCYFALVIMLAIFLVTYAIEKSRLGYYLVALREDEDAAQALGVNTTLCKLIAMMVSAFFTAICGTLAAQYVLFIEPISEFSVDRSILFALISIIGGIGTTAGPIIGSFILTPLQEFLRAWLGGQYQGLHIFIYGCILIAVVMLLPGGVIVWIKAIGKPLFSFGPKFQLRKK